MEERPELSEEIDLITRVAARDREAFSRLYDNYAGVLYTMALRVLNNPDDAQDVLQDVFVQIWDKAASYDVSRGKPLTWAITMTRNKAIDRLRSTQRRLRLRDDVESETEVFTQAGNPGAAEEVYAHESNEIVRNAVMQLSDEQREAIELAFFKGLTQHEIADRLNQPLGTIKARIRRGMIKLRTIIKPEA